MKFTTKSGAVYLRVQEEGVNYLTRLAEHPVTDENGPSDKMIQHEPIAWEDDPPIVGSRYLCRLTNHTPLVTTSVVSIDEL